MRIVHRKQVLAVNYAQTKNASKERNGLYLHLEKTRLERKLKSDLLLSTPSIY